MRSAPFYWVSLVPKGSKKVRVDLTSRVLSFDFEDVESKADKLVLTVDNYDLANFDTPVWRKGNIIEVGWGYADGSFAPARQMLVRKVTGSVKLKIEAGGKEFLMDRLTKTQVFNDLKRSDVVRLLAKENGFTEDTIDIEDTKEVLPTITQARQTDAKFMRKLAAKEGFEFYVDFDGFHWHSRRIGQKPVRELRWFNDQRGEIQSFKIDNDISPIPGGIPGRKRVRGRNPLTKKNFEFVVDYAKDFSPHLAPQAEVSAELLAGLGNVARAVIDTTNEILEAVAIRKTRGRGQKQKFLTVKMKVAIIGDPLLLAKTIVKVVGIGNRLSGNYYVKSVRHKISGSGYTGSLELLRDGHKENRAQEKLFAFVPGGRGGKGSAADGGCVAMLNRVVFRIEDLVETRNDVFVEISSAGGKIPGSLQSFLGTRVRRVNQLKPTVTTHPNSVELTAPILAELKNIGTEIFNNQFLIITKESRFRRIASAARDLAAISDRATQACKEAAEARESSTNTGSASSRDGQKSTEAQRLERQRLEPKTKTVGGAITTAYRRRRGQ